MKIKEQLEKIFNETARGWVNCETTIELNNWKDKRVYVNIKHHKYSCDMWIDINNKDLYTKSTLKNATLTEAYTNLKEFVKENMEEVIKAAE